MITKYEIKAIDNIVCLPGTGILRAVVDIPIDISYLFPYINGFIKKARYLPKIPWIRFTFYGYPEKGLNKYDIACKSHQIILGKFMNNEEANIIIKQAIDFLNYIDSNRDKIEPNYKEWAPPSAITILKYLPQTNCRKCGLQSCMAFAVKLSQGDVEPEHCPEIISKNLEELKDLL